MPESSPCEVTVIYKGGAVMKFRCTDFSLGWNKATGAVTRASWQNARPQPFLLGLDEIAAVYVDEDIEPEP